LLRVGVGRDLQERFDRLGGLRVVALGADDLVGVEHDRVDAGGLVAVDRLEVDPQVVTFALDPGALDGLADVLGGQLDRAGTAVDVGYAEAEVLGESPLGVGDAALGGLHRVGDLVAALPALADAARGLELLALTGPGTG